MTRTPNMALIVCAFYPRQDFFFFFKKEVFQHSIYLEDSCVNFSVLQPSWLHFARCNHWFAKVVFWPISKWNKTVCIDSGRFYKNEWIKLVPCFLYGSEFCMDHLRNKTHSQTNKDWILVCCRKLVSKETRIEIELVIQAYLDIKGDAALCSILKKKWGTLQEKGKHRQ